MSISLPPEHATVIKELAGDKFNGNVSAAIRRLLETHPVTKSRFALSS
jgi:Arc/MetJ-type ribon-helix-helix transcriptional regulator